MPLDLAGGLGAVVVGLELHGCVWGAAVLPLYGIREVQHGRADERLETQIEAVGRGGRSLRATEEAVTLGPVIWAGCDLTWQVLQS